MTRSIKAVLAIAALALLSLVPIAAANASSDGPSSAAERSIIPRQGFYEGRDSHHHHIRFNFHGNQMSHFRVDHYVIGGAHVSGAQWHHTCHNGLCTRAKWDSSTQVSGYWNDSNGGHDVPFIAHWSRSHE